HVGTTSTWPSARRRSKRRRSTAGRRYAATSPTSCTSLSRFWRRPPTTSARRHQRDRPSQAGGVAPWSSAMVFMRRAYRADRPLQIYEIERRTVEAERSEGVAGEGRGAETPAGASAGGCGC